jgi:hypothetical protein
MVIYTYICIFFNVLIMSFALKRLTDLINLQQAVKYINMKD